MKYSSPFFASLNVYAENIAVCHINTSDLTSAKANVVNIYIIAALKILNIQNTLNKV